MSDAFLELTVVEKLTTLVLGSRILQALPLWLWTGRYLTCLWSLQCNTDPPHRILTQMPLHGVLNERHRVSHTGKNLHVHFGNDMLLIKSFFKAVR